MEQLQQLAARHKIAVTNSRFKTIEKLKEQQWKLHFGNESKVPGRIISLHKDYVRPIILGKEVKPVEFGPKVHILLVNEISFIKHLSYDNFNEGARLQSAIHLQRRYFGACHQMGADAIYDTNANRRYCTKNYIATNFIPKSNEGNGKVRIFFSLPAMPCR